MAMLPYDDAASPEQIARRSTLGLHLLLRWIGAWVDFIVLFLFFLVPNYLLGDEGYRATMAIWLGAAILYFPIGEGFWGRTVGKLFTGLIVVDEAGRPPGILKATIRTVLRLIEVIWVPLVAVISVVCSDKRQRLGDMVARTYVVCAAELASSKATARRRSPPIDRLWSDTITLLAFGIALIGVAAHGPWEPSQPQVDGTPEYRLRLLANGAAVELSGGMPAGTADALQILLDAAPATRIVYLNSLGGNVAEGLKIHDLIRDRKLATYTFKVCSSACTLAFLGGSPRYLATGAKLGFHSAHFGDQVQNTPRGINDEQRHILEMHGAPPAFVQKAISTPPDSIWYPTPEQLIRSGIIDQILDPGAPEAAVHSKARSANANDPNSRPDGLWAAIDPNIEASSSVVWATTRDEVRKLAIEACKRTSQTCAPGPAHTNDMNDVFAVMCCTAPKAGCAAGVAHGRDGALAAVKKSFAEAGFGKCTLKSYFSAGNGARG